MGRFSVLPFPTQKCDQPAQLRRFIKLFDSFANILDFNFVMVEEAKQYLCDTQISELHWKSGDFEAPKIDGRFSRVQP